MSNNCQFCGINLHVPIPGLLILKQSDRKYYQNIDLPIQKENTSEIYYKYENKRQLKNTLNVLIEAGLTNSSVKLSDCTESFSFPVISNHLYERLTNPLLTSIIQDGQLHVHLQPIIDIPSLTIVGYESLLRTKYEHVNPAMLFSFAHKAGLHSMLDQKARELAVIAKAKQLKPRQKCFINFLPSTIYNPEFCLKHTFNVVQKYSIDPSDLVFEVVETEKIEDIAHLKNILQTYQSSGMKVALDDVGSGYSTVGMLELLKPDYVKIDKEYIRNCYKDKTKQSFLLDVKQRAESLNITLLAEGIETIEEFNWLEQSGFQLGQGYLIGKPSQQPIDQIDLPT